MSVSIDRLNCATCKTKEVNHNIYFNVSYMIYVNLLMLFTISVIFQVGFIKSDKIVLCENVVSKAAAVCCCCYLYLQVQTITGTTCHTKLYCHEKHKNETKSSRLTCRVQVYPDTAAETKKNLKSLLLSYLSWTKVTVTKLCLWVIKDQAIFVSHAVPSCQPRFFAARPR